MKILSGVYPFNTYEGEIIVNGSKQEFQNIKDSEKSGIAIIYQELALVKLLNIAENIFLGNEFVEKGKRLVLIMDVKENISLASLDKISKLNTINDNEEIKIANEYVKSMKIKTPSIEQKLWVVKVL